MDTEQRISFLLDRYVNNSCSVEELNELFALVSKDSNKAYIEKKLEKIWDNTNSLPKHSDKEWKARYAMIINNPEITRSPRRKISAWYKFSVAAVALICLTTGLIIYFNSLSKNQFTNNQPVLVQENLSPGNNKAILTLENGIKVILDGNNIEVITSQAGVQITKAADGQLIYKPNNLKPDADDLLTYNTIETPKGGQYQISMPDGTRVWLNAMSTLKYPVVFKGDERKVELIGEGYFEVVENKKAPFKVVSGIQEVEVLGTHFNVNSYPDEKNIITTLLEGAVRVASMTNGTNATLIPGEQAVLLKNSIAVNKIDTELAVAWKNGNFIFHSNQLDYIMRQLSRWYNLDIVYQNDQIKKLVFSGSISRFEDANKVFEVLELTGLVHFKIEGRRIIVMQ